MADCKQNNFDCVYQIKLAHKINNQARDLYREADRLIEEDLKRKIMDSIAIVDCSIRKEAQAVIKKVEAEAEFNTYKKECVCCPEIKDMKCQEHLDQALLYRLEEDAIAVCILEKLNALLDLINDYAQADEQGDYYLNQYTNCIHNEYNNCSC